MRNRIQEYLFMIMLLIAIPGWAQERIYEPVVLTGDKFPQFNNMPMNQFTLLAYNSQTEEWTPIPFQIDAKTADGSYFDDTDGLLDAYDELVFLVRDLGDSAAADNFPQKDAINFLSRYQIKAHDPLAESDANGFVYLFKVDQPFVTEEDLVSVNPQQDFIVSNYYEMGFYDKNGLPDSLIITTENGGNGQNFMDRLKIRLLADVDYLGFKFTGTLNEEDGIIQVDSANNPRYLDGPVRIVRDLDVKLRFSLGPGSFITLNDIYTFQLFFFPFSMMVNSPEIDLSVLEGMGTVKMIRFSFDYSPAASGMTFYNPNNELTVDGSPDQINSDLVPDDINWQLVSGNPGSMLTLTFVPALGDQQSLYYYDNSQDGTGDGTTDTGDSTSFGDSGFIVTGDISSGIFDFISILYLLPGNLTKDDAEVLYAQYQNPLQFEMEFQDNTTNIVEQDFSHQPKSYSLIRSYPNPFLFNKHQSLQIQLILAERDHVQFSLYNLLGQKIIQLSGKDFAAGEYNLLWDLRKDVGVPLPSGLYWLVARGNSTFLKQKILIIQ